MLSSEISVLENEVKRARRYLDQRIGEARAVGARGKQIQTEVADLRVKTLSYEQASAVLSRIGEERQTAAQHQIEDLVTRGLQSIFNEDLTFHVVQAVKNKQPVVEFVVRSHMPDGQEVETEVIGARGGGLAEVVGFLLRLVVMLLSKDKQETILFLDESFGMLSAHYEVRMAEFLKEIVENTGIQVLMISHSNAFDDVADRKYRFELDHGVTKVVEY